MSSIHASIIVCTYNRCQSLRETLASLDDLNTRGLDVEVIVVDNNSRDGTRKVFEEWRRDTPLHAQYLFECQQGLSFARNAGVAKSRGEIVAFTDDDVTLDPDWIGALVAAFRKTGAAAVGGKILPKWPAPVPRWLTEDLYSYLALLDLGEAPKILDEPYIYGANFAVRRRWMERNSFSTTLGRVGTSLRIGEDTALLVDIMRQGGKLVYWPCAVVHHRIEESRLTKTYFRRWHCELGQMQGELFDGNHRRSLCGVPYRVYREILEHSYDWGKAAVSGRPAFVHELHVRRLTTAMRAGMRRSLAVPSLRLFA